MRTFLFTDIEGSYRQWERHPEGMPHALAAHDAVLHEAVFAQGGTVFKTIGDAVCAVFDTPIAGVRAAVAAQRALFGTDWAAFGLAQPLTVRMAVQTGEAQERDGDYSGLVLNRISRLMRAGYGGQVLISPPVAEEVERAGLSGVGARDLGARRLRDVPGASHIYQLEIDGLPTAFPPLQTLDAIAHNLPVALNACLDRDDERLRIRQLLIDSPARLVTLLGPGGIGKTRLALDAGSQLIDAFAGGVWFVDLSGVRDASLAPAAVASVLGARIVPGVEPIDAIVATAEERALLLILDNCEQIVEGVAGFVAALLPRCSGVRVLATSRVPLHIRGEQRIDVGPLPVEHDELAGPAVQLFLERAQQLRPSFEMTDANRASIFEICHRVDGIPLALELAAARVAVLSPEALRTRLSSRLSLLTSSSRDLPERHQTLRAAIAWSYALLSEDEQRVFRSLSVFQGGWSFAAAQSVLGLDEVETMEALASLRDKSLVRLSETDDGEPRYSMFETIQEFGGEQLAAYPSHDVAMLAAHLSYFLTMTEAASPFLQGGPEQERWLHVLDHEIGNVRAALQYCLENGDHESSLLLCWNTWYFWSIRGLSSEGRQWFERAIERATEVSPAMRAGALRRIGNLAIESGDTRMAEGFYRLALEIDEATEDDIGRAQSIAHLGMVASMQGRTQDAVRLLDQSIETGREFDKAQMVIISSINRAITARDVGDFVSAHRIYENIMDLQRQLDDENGFAWSQFYLGQIAIDVGDLDAATELIEESYLTFERLQEHEGASRSKAVKANLLLRDGKALEARALLVDALAAHVQRNDRMAMASSFEILAEIEIEIGNYIDSARALGSAEGHREFCATPVPEVDRPAIDRVRTRLVAELGELAALREIARGRIVVGGKSHGLLTLKPSE